MSTALDIIKRAMRLNGVYQIGETPSADESSTGLEALNSMIESWATENLFVFVKSLDVVPLVANQANYVIGPSGALVTNRPVEILAASTVTFNGVTYPIFPVPLRNFTQIPTSQSGIPSTLYVQMDMPNVTLQVWPVPSVAMTLNLWSNKQIQSFTSLTDVLNLPLGYERALAYSLAEEIAPEYDTEVSQGIMRKAMQARKNIKRINTEVPLLTMPRGIPRGRILAGINS